MQTLCFQIDIAAMPHEVWQVLTDAGYYSQWAKAFSANSQFRGQWQQDQHIDFFDQGQGGTRALIEEMQSDEWIVLRHLALISETGEVVASGPVADKWIGTIETFQLTCVSGKTQLNINVICHSEFTAMFNDAWPKAMSSIKSLSENALPQH